MAKKAKMSGNQLFDRERVKELLLRLELEKGTKTVQPKPVLFSPEIQDILNGRTFYDASMPTALRQASEYAGRSGIVVSMPEFITARAKVDTNHAFWQQAYTVHSEEDIGVDKKGAFYTKGEPILVVVHGGGILTPDRIQQAYNEGLINGSVRYREEEFDALLEGRLLDGTTFQLYGLEEVQEGLSGLPHQFGVVMPYKTAYDSRSGYHKKKEFLENPLVIARAAGSLDNLEAFYEKAEEFYGNLGNWHPFVDRDALIRQGHVLVVDANYKGFFGNYNLERYIDGRFIGVAPEVLSKEK